LDSARRRFIQYDEVRFPTVTAASARAASWGQNLRFGR
jgi:hypothetical protein